jgi:hypothetical protein
MLFNYYAIIVYGFPTAVDFYFLKHKKRVHFVDMFLGGRL